MIYRESYSGESSDGIPFQSIRYYFDVGSKYLLNIGHGSHGAIQKKAYYEHDLPYKKRDHKDFKFEDVNATDVPKVYLSTMIKWAFERHMEK